MMLLPLFLSLLTILTISDGYILGARHRHHPAHYHQPTTRLHGFLRDLRESYSKDSNLSDPAIPPSPPTTSTSTSKSKSNSPPPPSPTSPGAKFFSRHMNEQDKEKYVQMITSKDRFVHSSRRPVPSGPLRQSLPIPPPTPPRPPRQQQRHGAPRAS